MSTSSSTTYVTRAVPASGPSTSEFPAVRDPASRGGWPPQNHRPFLVASGIGFGLAVLTLFIYGVMASHPGVALPARTLVHGLGITLLMLSGLSLLLAYAVRAHDRAITAATERGVTEVHGLDALHPVIQGVDIHLSDIVGRLESAVGQRVEELDRRLAAVEREVAEQDQEYERGWVNGAAKTAEVLSPNGRVRHLHPKGAPPEPRRPR